MRGEIRSLRPSTAWAWTLVVLLAACGGADTPPADAQAAAAAGTVRSDQAQPSSADPALFLSNGQPARGTDRIRALADLGVPVDDPAAVEVGDLLFHDPRLSASGAMSCGTCHVEAFGHADAPGVTLPKGGAHLDLAGMRSSMTARYLNLAPPFRLSKSGTPSGGFLWDGRADNRFEQAFHGGPFFNPVEMALPGSATEPQALTKLVREAPYWPQLLALYVDRPDLIDTEPKLFEQIAILLETYQRGDADYNLFDSKFDAVRAGTQAFTAQEARGWALFTDKQRGNCASCHTAGMDDVSLFTNFGYAAIGVPRNHAGPKNADPDFYDLGLCAREKAPTNKVDDSAIQQPRYCGLFKTPTLRNVERTAPYFHNAGMASLEDAIRFHFERDEKPAKWYRKADGSRDRIYNDLPRRYQGNLADGRPFNGRYQPSQRDINDLVAFLKTLNDADQGTPLPAR
jgi:cytochrome c peroxidase